MPKGVQALVLCEDIQASVFARRMLNELGYRKLRVLPFGPASGEQHVRESYPTQLRSYRSRAARMKLVLVVHIDADILTVPERRAQLDRELEREGVKPRSADEAVAILVPKRNIETWIYFFLKRAPVDEQTQYPKYRQHESDTRPAANEFARHVRAETRPPGAPPSLLDGLSEARRIC